MYFALINFDDFIANVTHKIVPSFSDDSELFQPNDE